MKIESDRSSIDANDQQPASANPSQGHDDAAAEGTEIVNSWEVCEYCLTSDGTVASRSKDGNGDFMCDGCWDAGVDPEHSIVEVQR